MRNPISNTSTKLHGIWGSQGNSFLAVGDLGTILQFDSDGDGVPDYQDNCPNNCNTEQLDADNDAIGDVCDSTQGCGGCGGVQCEQECSPPDIDSDGIPDFRDNCPTVSNSAQTDTDHDSLGDACDDCSNDPTNDIDSDGICGGADNCPNKCNTRQLDADSDGIGDVCDPTPGCGGCGQPQCEQQC
jgi:hypothetical protein